MSISFFVVRLTVILLHYILLASLSNMVNVTGQLIKCQPLPNLHKNEIGSLHLVTIGKEARVSCTSAWNTSILALKPCTSVRRKEGARVSRTRGASLDYIVFTALYTMTIRE